MHSGRNNVLVIALGAALACVGTLREGVASTFLVGVAPFSFTTGSCSPTVSPAPGSPIQGNFTSATNGFGSATALAFAGGGGLGGSVLATSQGNSNASNQIGACFRAEMTIDDIVISSTTAAPGTPVPTRVFAGLTGEVAINSGDSGGAGANVFAFLEPIGFGVPGTALAGSNIGVNIGEDDAPAVFATTLISQQFSPTVGDPFAIAFALRTQGVAISSRLPDLSAGFAQVNANFLSTFGFVTDGPVFDLPEGFTAESVSGNIVDNRFVLDQVAAIPAPAAFWLLAPGILALIGGIRRR